MYYVLYGFNVQVPKYLHKINHRQYTCTDANLCYTDNLICLINKTILIIHTQGSSNIQAVASSQRALYSVYRLGFAYHYAEKFNICGSLYI